jgi:hypothetical protein
VETHESSGRKCVRVVYGKFHITAESEFARGKTCRDVSTTTATKTLSVYSITVNVPLLMIAFRN